MQPPTAVTRTDRPMEVLLLCDYQPRIAATVRDHIEALETLSRHRYHRLTMLGNIPRSVDLSRFDAIVVHYTLVACNERFVSREARRQIAAFTGLKALFIQDEYRHVDASVAAMREMGVHVLFTCVPGHEIEKVYPEAELPGVRKVNVLTGYVPPALLEMPTPPPSQRRPVVGYRGRKVPAWLGDLGQEKYWIGIRFRDDARAYPGLECDISFREEDRLYGDAWLDFLVRCRAVLGVESGASVFDFSGGLQERVDADLRADPDVSYETLKSRHFADLEGRIQLAQISPRCFESAALGTVMVLYPGDYSGRLQPWRHYIPLAKDHGDMADVVRALLDGELCDRIAAQAREEVALAPENSYQGFLDVVDSAMEAAFEPRMAASAPAYSAREFRRATALNVETLRRQGLRLALTYVHFVVFRVLLGRARPETRDRIHRWGKWLYYTLTLHAWRTRRPRGG